MSILSKIPNVYISKFTLEDLLKLPVSKMNEILVKIQQAPGQIDELTFQVYKVVDNIRIDVETLQDFLKYMSNP
jgi:hypothetical protein